MPKKSCKKQLNKKFRYKQTEIPNVLAENNT